MMFVLNIRLRTFYSPPYGGGAGGGASRLFCWLVVLSFFNQ